MKFCLPSQIRTKAFVSANPPRLRSQAALPLAVLGLAFVSVSCQSPAEYRDEADRVADDIITQKQKQAFGEDGVEPLTIEKPEDTLRRRLLLEQDLPIQSDVSLGTQAIDPVEYWPDDEYLETGVGESDGLPSLDNTVPVITEGDNTSATTALQINLVEALQIAAGSNREYQRRKESVFLTALDLDLERDEFRPVFDLDGNVEFETDTTGPTTTAVAGGSDLSITQRLKNGMTLTGAIGLDLVKLLSGTQNGSSALSFDASVSIPLLRGSGRHIVTESLVQAERDALYAIWDFERFKRTFAVDIASDYFGVLQSLNRVDNERENYRNLVIAARRSRNLAENGRIPENQVDQALQDELSARNRWVSAIQSYQRDLDNYKLTLGLPTDARIVLDRTELETLAERAKRVVLNESESGEETTTAIDDEATVTGIAADAPVDLSLPTAEDGGPYEIPEDLAIDLALNNRLDLLIADSEVIDAQRGVVVAADGLQAELTLLGSVSTGSTRGITGGNLPGDTKLRFDQATYDALLSIDLPIERTAERNTYRSSLIELERRVRAYQELEDRVKLSVRNNLRTLLEQRETVRIQALSVELAERRVESNEVLLDLGRVEIRDLLEAQSALLGAQNALTAAIVSYRVTELALQRDLGLLEVDADGLWTEFDPDTVAANTDIAPVSQTN